MTWLVTGAAGFVGLNLLERLAPRGEAVVALDQRAVAPDVAACFARDQLVTVAGDCRDPGLLTRLVADHGVTRVLHAAAITPGPAREREDPTSAVSVNLAGTAAALQAAANGGATRFVHASSVAVFGPGVPDGEVIDEDRPHAPSTLYAITKSASEAIVRRYAEVSGLSCIIGRLGVVFGRHEVETGVRDTMSPFYHATKRARAGDALVLPRPARRNWQYATDAADTLIALGAAEAPRHGVYNLGPSAVWTVAEWCEMLAARYPAFRHSIGDVPGGPIGLHNPSDGGLLSWHRFEAEFAPGPRVARPEAFADYVGWLEGRQ
jgi:nucleoside-diphosphate-sugar epimerase